MNQGPQAASSAPRRRRADVLAGPVHEVESVTTLELFFDLVFVFALTQVTAEMANDMTVGGLARGLLIIALLWWSWTGYAWLANFVRADEGIMRIGVLTAMAAMFVLALGIPEAFDDAPGGLPGPVVVAVCYFLFRALHLVLFYISSAGDAGLRTQLLRFTVAVVPGTALLLVAAGTDGATQMWLWVAALAADYLGTYLGGARGWRIASPAHFAERHGLIVIVALGESIVAIGVGAARLPISWPIIVASLLGLILAASLWWTYFDVSALVAEDAMSTAAEQRRAALARDAYSFFHLPIMAGIILLALGLKKVLEYVSDMEHHSLNNPLKGEALAALVGGVVLYLLAHVAFQLRTTGRLPLARFVVALLVLPTAWLGQSVPALGSLAVLTAIVVGLVAFESVRNAAERYHARNTMTQP